MNIYPYSTALILDDEIYTNYGGLTGTSTAFQRNAAYITAETRMTSYIGTFLLPTIVTGTYTYDSSRFIVTDYGYVSQILSAKMLSTKGATDCSLHETTGCAYIREDTFGYLDYSALYSACGCVSYYKPYQFQVAYEAGLPTGTANHPNILQALTVVAELALNEMSRPSANEGVGDVGIEEFSTFDYKEKRKKWERTALGDSARAPYAAGLVRSVIKRAVKPLRLR